MDEDLRRFLAEDLGEAGDVTTLAIAPDATARGVVLSRSRAVLAGLDEALATFRALGAEAAPRAQEGDWVNPEAPVLEVRGRALAVLSAERLALNFLMRMSGIATLTRELQQKASAVNPRCRVAATRKTTPGFRRYEKRAVAVGGGDPHRFALHDAFLVKDNHRALLPDVAEAVRRCRALAPDKFLQVEVETLEDALSAAGAGADALLIDNRGPGEFGAWAREVRARFPRVMIEASGGITPVNLELYAREADRVSLGFLTHSAPARDFSLEFTVAP